MYKKNIDVYEGSFQGWGRGSDVEEREVDSKELHKIKIFARWYSGDQIKEDGRWVDHAARFWRLKMRDLLMDGSKIEFGSGDCVEGLRL